MLLFFPRCHADTMRGRVRSGGWALMCLIVTFPKILSTLNYLYHSQSVGRGHLSSSFRIDGEVGPRNGFFVCNKNLRILRCLLRFLGSLYVGEVGLGKLWV